MAHNCSKINWRWFLIHTVVNILLYPLIFLVMFIVVPIISILLLTVRWVIDKLAHTKRDLGRLGKIVSTTDSLFLRDEIYTNPKCSCVLTFTVEGNLDISRTREIFRDKILSATVANGALKYPKFRQCLKQWCGYFFWKDVPDFDFEKQISLHSRSMKVGQPTNDEDINEIIQEMLNKAWVVDQPLWDTTVIPNYKPGNSDEGQIYSCVLFRMHHIIGDAFTLFLLSTDWLTALGAQIESVMAEKLETLRNPEVPRASKIMWNITLPFRLAYHATEMVSIILACPLYWTVSQKARKTGKCWTQSTGPIPVKVIKDIKNHFGVNFTSVLWAVQIGAHHEVLKRRGQNLAEFLPAAVSVLLPGHTGKMTVNSVGSLIKLPLGEEDAVKRLLKCYKEEHRHKSYIGAILAMNWVKFCGMFPPFMIKWFMSSVLGFVTSNVSFNDFELYGDVENKTNFITGVAATPGLQIGTHGIFMANVSYNEHITFNTTVHEQMGKKESLQFSSAIINQINILHQLTNP